MSKPIIVGYDGSAASDVALAWAVPAAAQRGLPLEVLVTWSAPGLTTGIGMGAASGAELTEQLHEDAKKNAAHAIEVTERLDASLGKPSVVAQVVAGSSAKVLVERSKDATMIVVGTHGKHGFSGALLGSVSRQVSTHAHCPVVIARESMPPMGKEVIVGIDGSAASMTALDFAFDHASRNGYGVRVLHAWEVPSLIAPTTTPGFGFHELLVNFEGAESRSAAEALAGYSERYPDVKVTTEVIHGMPVRALVDASEHAPLVVVGSRGHGGFLGLLLGSVSHGVSHFSKSSVAIVH